MELPGQMSRALNAQQELTRFIVDSFLFGTEPSFSSDDSLLDKGILDSTGILEIISFIENRYDIKVEEVELIPENLDSISRLSAFVQRKSLSGSEARHPETGNGSRDRFESSDRHG